MPVADMVQNGATDESEDAEGAEESTERGPRDVGNSKDLAAAIRRIMQSRGLSTREVVRRVDRRHVGTIYRLLAGRTTDPWATTIVSLCSALNCDPDELLSAENALDILDPEIRNTLTDISRLAEEDRWLALDMLRSILARRLYGLRGPKQGSAALVGDKNVSE